MKKKIIVGIISGSLFFGAGSLTFAQSDGEGEGEGLLNFGQMKPHIEKMHPDLTTQEQKDMFEACHGKGGMMKNDHHENSGTMMNHS
ncbi:hypothetical protein WQ57_23225 [Mesobacillus campisalis]|uniref:FAD/FMN-containing dehydrogenase n=1 Tax=Mesobacillus campisalis TaxID=1408103 RepID=A0A0M2SNB3_9BACI|nr:hypothetical protein [Mesobacillus campisalis]KKK34337.1 hypothetical protein WQ57_23225 [Mesobacillus campisalis]